VCIIAIVITKLAELYLSPGCIYYDPVTNAANVYVGAAVGVPSAWNLSHTPRTTTDALGHLKTYTPGRDNPGCVPLPKAAAPAPFLLPAGAPANATAPLWGSPAHPWPRDRGLAITGTFGGPPSVRLPNLSLLDGELLAGAIIITLVASLESIAIAKALASRHRQPDLDANKEYVALGLANFFGAFTGAYPAGGSFSRSALNDEVGATSPVAVLVVALLVGVTLKAASVLPMFYYLPQNALSAVVIVALTNLVDAQHFVWLLTYDRKDAALWLIAFLGVLFLGVEIGILVAVIASLALVVMETLFAPAPQLGLVPGATRRTFRSLQQYPDACTIPGIVIQRVEAPIIFFNAPAVCARLRAIVYGSDAAHDSRKRDGASSGVRAVIVDFSNVPYVDSAFLDGFGDLIEQYKRAEVLLAFCNTNSTVLYKLTHTHLLSQLNSQFGEQRDWVFLTVSDAVDVVSRYEPPTKAVKYAHDVDDDEYAV
jgi:MFS superfamily sulfate permease-like transporter